MRAMQPTGTQEKVRAWQDLLTKLDYTPGKADGYFGPQTQQATIQFQRKRGITPDGVVGPETLKEAAKVAEARKVSAPIPVLKPNETLGRQFEIGMHQKKDIRQCRPYFLALLPKVTGLEGAEAVNEKILDAIKNTVEQRIEKDKLPITDVYILSHGWHRNFFGALAAYDRLVSRMAALQRRHRLPHPDDNFSPLYITLHWHSDPGANNWQDRLGRRNKANFLQRAFQLFQPKEEYTEAHLANDFEDIYQLFSRVSALGVPPLQAEMDAEAERLVENLNEHADLRFLPERGKEAYRNEKVATIWRCYHEAEPMRALIDQEEKPGRYYSPPQAFKNLGKFVVSVVTLATLVGLIFQVTSLTKYLKDAWRLIWEWICQHPLWSVALLVILSVPAAFALWITARCQQNVQSQQDTQADKSSKGFPLILPAWLLVQLVWTFPLLVTSLVGYLFGGFAYFLLRNPTRPWLLFDERFGQRNSDVGKDKDKLKRNARYWMARWARWPLEQLQKAIAEDSSFHGMVDTLNNLFAFWEMQRKGVEAGQEAAEFVKHMFEKIPARADGQPIRVHFLGHSFGCLVVSNAVRALALDPPAESEKHWEVHTLCLVQAAISSNWFEEEEKLKNFVKGSIVNIFSRYDTANGFYYPVANNSRKAAGYVGLLKVGAEDPLPPLGPGGEFASLVKPPKLRKLWKQRASKEELEKITAQLSVPPLCVNLDASRIIYEGPPALGGGHGDIFKDDIVHLVWAASLLPESPPESPAPPKQVSELKQELKRLDGRLVLIEQVTHTKVVVDTSRREDKAEVKTE